MALLLRRRFAGPLFVAQISFGQQGYVSRGLYMNEGKLKELRQLVEEVMCASTKKEARNSVRRLEFLASCMKSTTDSYLSGKLSEIVSFAKEASGNVKGKDHWISCVEQSWYVFEGGVKCHQSQRNTEHHE